MATGDLAGTYPAPSVVRLRGQPISSSTPSNGQVLTFDGMNWTPTTPIVGGGVTDHGALSGSHSVAIGNNSSATGDKSFALGSFASTNGQVGAFVYGDNSAPFNSVRSPAPNSFTVRAAGGTTFFSNAALTAGVNLAPGAGAWTSVSDVNRKHLFREANGAAVLQKIATLPIRSWSYKSQDTSIRHLGPTAQDFYAAFGLGKSTLGISTIDIDGVNLLATQALEKRTREFDRAKRCIAQRTGRVACPSKRVAHAVSAAGNRRKTMRTDSWQRPGALLSLLALPAARHRPLIAEFAAPRATPHRVRSGGDHRVFVVTAFEVASFSTAII